MHRITPIPHAFPPPHSPSLPITSSTHRMPDRQLVLGRLLGGGVVGEDHVGVEGAFGLDQIHLGSGTFGHGLLGGVGWRGWWLGLGCSGGALWCGGGGGGGMDWEEE